MPLPFGQHLPEASTNQVSRGRNSARARGPTITISVAGVTTLADTQQPSLDSYSCRMLRLYSFLGGIRRYMKSIVDTPGFDVATSFDDHVMKLNKSVGWNIRMWCTRKDVCSISESKDCKENEVFEERHIYMAQLMLGDDSCNNKIPQMYSKSSRKILRVLSTMESGQGTHRNAVGSANK